MSAFLTRSFRSSLHTKHENAIVKGIAMSENMKVCQRPWIMMDNFNQHTIARLRKRHGLQYANEAGSSRRKRDRIMTPTKSSLKSLMRRQMTLFVWLKELVIQLTRKYGGREMGPLTATT
jgi:hypothetical protein